MKEIIGIKEIITSNKKVRGDNTYISFKKEINKDNTKATV